MSLLLIALYVVAVAYFYLWALEIIHSNHPELHIPENAKVLTAIVFGVLFPIFIVIGYFKYLRRK